MADGSLEDRAGRTRIEDITFSASEPSHGDTKKCSGQSSDSGRLQLSFYTELEASESCEKSETRGVVADCSVANATTDFRKTPGSSVDNGEDRKKRCFDRYDSSESSDRIMSNFYCIDENDRNSSGSIDPFYLNCAQDVNAILEKEEQDRLRFVSEQKKTESFQNIKKKNNLSLKRKLPKVDQQTPVSDSSFFIRTNRTKGHHLIRIEILEINNSQQENNANCQLSVQYVVTDNYDNMMYATEELINKIIQKLSVPESL